MPLSARGKGNSKIFIMELYRLRTVGGGGGAGPFNIGVWYSPGEELLFIFVRSSFLVIIVYYQYLCYNTCQNF